MSDKRDAKINDRLEEMSGFIKHSEKDNVKKNAAAKEAQKNDILNELPAELRFKALQNGMSLEELRDLYAEVKVEYYAHKLELQGAQRVEVKQRRQDNVRERIAEQEKERQNEQTRVRKRELQRGERHRS